MAEDSTRSRSALGPRERTARRSALRRVRLALALAALPLIAASCPLPFGPKEVGVHVPDAAGFVVGTPVLLKGVQVAQVTNVVIEDGKPTLLIEFDHEHRDTLKTGADIVLQTPGLFGGGAHALVIDDVGQGDPLPGGARVQGETPASSLLKGAGEALRGAADALEGALGATRQAETEARKIIDQASEAAEKASAAGAEAVERLRKETLPEVERQLKALEARLRKAGKSMEADGIAKELDKLLGGD